MARRAYPPSTTTHRHFSSREENGHHTSSSRDLPPPPPLPPKPTRHHRSQHDSRIVFSNDYIRDHSAEPDQKVLKKELDSIAQNGNNDRKSPKTRHKITISENKVAMLLAHSTQISSEAAEVFKKASQAQIEKKRFDNAKAVPAAFAKPKRIYPNRQRPDTGKINDEHSRSGNSTKDAISTNKRAESKASSLRNGQASHQTTAEVSSIPMLFQGLENNAHHRLQKKPEAAIFSPPTLAAFLLPRKVEANPDLKSQWTWGGSGKDL